MKRVMMALGCAAVTMFAGCMCDQMAARDLQPKEAVECPEIRSEERVFRAFVREHRH